MRRPLTALIGLLIAWSIASTITAQGPPTVSGLVLNPDGSPSSGTSLELCLTPTIGCRSAQTDADGRFEFAASAESHVLALYDPLSDRRLFYLDGGDGNLSWDSDELTSLEVHAAGVTGIEISLPSPTELSGVILRSSGDPQAGANILLLSQLDGSFVQHRLTDGNGRFSFTVPQDDYWMLINAPGGFAQGAYHPDALGRFSEDQGNRGTLVVRGTPVTDVEITLPVRLDQFPNTVSGTVLFEDGSPAVGWSVRVCGEQCQAAYRGEDGSFRAPAAPGPTLISIVHRGEIVGRYHLGSPGNYSDDPDLYTALDLPGDDATGIDIRIPLPRRIAGRILQPDGSPSVETRVSVCREVPESSCLTTLSNSLGRFAIDVDGGDYYVAFTIESNERWYYHAGSDGHLISTGRRPERTFVSVPSGEALDLSVRIPQRDFVEVLISDAYRGPAYNATVELTVCRDRWTFASILPACLSPTEVERLDPSVRRLRSPTPDEPHYLRFSFDGYALGGEVVWYYSQDSPSGLTADITAATIFSAEHPPPQTLQVILPDLPRTIPVTLRLNPGVNVVGWSGGTISLAELARQLAALKGIVSIPRDPGESWSGYAVGYPDAPDIETNSLWWFYVAADEPISIVVETAAERHPYSSYGHQVEAGESFLVWAGPQTASLEQATAGLGQLRSPPRLLRWTGSDLVYRQSGVVRQGDVILIDSPRRFIAQLPIPWKPLYVLQGPEDVHWRHLKQRLESVQSFFWEEYGILRNDFTVYYRTANLDQAISDVPAGRCGSAWITITLVCAEPHAIARYYFRYLQWNMSNILNRPGWLIEGAMEYAAARFTQHEQGDTGDPLRLHRLSARNDTDESRALNELPAEIQSWGDDPAATRLAALAVDWLVRHSGDPDSLLDVFRRVSDYYLTDARNDHDWERAFEEAFGIAVGDFYERFAEYRANGFNPDPE